MTTKLQAAKVAVRAARNAEAARKFNEAKPERVRALAEKLRAAWGAR